MRCKKTWPISSSLYGAVCFTFVSLVIVKNTFIFLVIFWQQKWQKAHWLQTPRTGLHSFEHVYFIGTVHTGVRELLWTFLLVCACAELEFSSCGVNLLARAQRRCGLWLPVLQQLVWMIVDGIYQRNGMCGVVSTWPTQCRQSISRGYWSPCL